MTAELRRDKGVLGGVCAGLGARFGLDPLIFRVGFVVATTAGGMGLLAYLLLWIAIPRAAGPVGGAPRRRSRGSAEIALGFGLLLLSALVLFRAWGLWLGDAVTWPLVLVAVGAAVLWRGLGSGGPAAPTPAAPTEVTRTDAGAGERRAVSQTAPLSGSAQRRALGGAGLIALGALAFLWLIGGLRIGGVAVVIVVVAATAALILAPWWLRLWRGLDAERAERIRSQERAEVAAHLHDSVLQTLALVQTRAADPATVTRLARRQERELRQWLDGGRPGEAPGTLTAALRAAAAEIEDVHGVVVEVVTVGDRGLDEDAAALVAATREALVNAARHAGGGPVSLYVEVRDGRVEVFVRDRGAGFDPATVPADRRGVRESIVGRMARHNGSATVHAAPGQGTEVELVLEAPR